MQSNIGITMTGTASQPDSNAQNRASDSGLLTDKARGEDERATPRHMSQEQAQNIPIDQDPDDPASP